MVQTVHAVQDIKSLEERHELIDKVPDSHPLKQLITSCIMIDKNERPKAETVYKELWNLLHVDDYVICFFV